FAAEVAQPLMARALALVESREPPRIVGEQPELGRAVVVGGAQPAVHRGADVPFLLLRIAAPVVALRDAQPLFVPAVVVPRLHAARRLEHLADRAAAL